MIQEIAGVPGSLWVASKVSNRKTSRLILTHLDLGKDWLGRCDIGTSGTPMTECDDVTSPEPTERTNIIIGLRLNSRTP